jgi:GTPase SAR1 family protein
MVLVIGLYYSGKTVIIEKLKTENFIRNTLPTLGMSIDAFTVGNVDLHVVDLGEVF